MKSPKTNCLINDVAIKYFVNESNMPIVLTDLANSILNYNTAFGQLISVGTEIKGVDFYSVLNLIHLSQPIQKDGYKLYVASFTNTQKKTTAELLNSVILETENEKTIIFERHMILEDTIIQQISQVNVELSNLSRQLAQKNRQIEQAYEKINKLVNTDYLTNIFNRRYFFDRLDEMISLDKRAETDGFGAIMMDIDDFKKINDKYGHDVGDNILKEITEQINSMTRKEDVFARIGGEEFCVLVRVKGIEQLQNTADRMRMVCENIKIDNVSEVITLSFGATMYKAGEPADSLMKRVDIALYEAKNNGKNQVKYI